MQQNVTKIFFLIITIVSFSCATTKQIHPNQIDVLDALLRNSTNKVYYKTLVTDGTSLMKPIATFITDNLEFQFCDEVIIEESEIIFLKQEFKKLNVVNLYNVSKASSNKLTKQKIQYKTSFISLPILFRNNTMALIYTTQTYGNSFLLLQKEKDKWNVKCSSLITIE